MSGLHRGDLIGRPPPALAGIVPDGDFDSQPCRADRRGMVSLLRAIEDLFDAFVVPGISPGAEEVSDGVQIQQMLKRQSDFKSHYVEKRKVKNWIATGHWVSLPVFFIRHPLPEIESQELKTYLQHRQCQPVGSKSNRISEIYLIIFIYSLAVCPAGLLDMIAGIRLDR
jgi:hypothetical protein